MGYPLLLWRKNRLTAQNAIFLAPTFAALRPSFSTPTGLASYVGGAYSMTGSGIDGTKLFTRTGGDPVADAGTGTWQAVVEYDDGRHEFNIVVSRSSDDFTLAHALSGTAVALHSGHASILGQHLSQKGSIALAQYSWGLKRREVARYQSSLTMWHGDVFDYNFSVPSVRNPDVWQSYGGLPTTNHPLLSTANLETTGAFVHADATICVAATTDASGEGYQLTLDAAGRRHQLSFSCGFADSSLVAAGAVSVLADGNSIYSATFDTFVSWHSIDIPAGTSEVVVRITRTTAGTTNYTLRVGQLDFMDMTGVEDPDDGFLQPNDKLLLIGDSWFDTDEVNWGLAYANEIEAQMSAAGGAGSVVSEAISGSQISDWIDDLRGWLATHSPTKVVLHSGLNELNSAVTATNFWRMVNQVFATCRSARVPCLYLMQSATAAVSQAQSLANYMAMQDVADHIDRYPKFITEWLNSVTTKELGLATAVVNVRSKSAPGRQVLRVTDGVTVAPDGPLPSDTWSAV